MIDNFLHWLQFTLLHVHTWDCIDRPPDNLTSSERWYWHVHECLYCPKTIAVMKGECDGAS